MCRKLSVIAFLSCLLAGCRSPFPDIPPVPAYRPAPVLPEDDIPAGNHPLLADGTPVPELTETLGLDACIRVALRYHRRTRIADRQVLIAMDEVEETRRENWPKASAEANWEVYSQDPAGGSDLDSATGRLSLTVPVYDFGRTTYRARALSLQADATALTAKRVRQTLAVDVSRAYFRVLEAEKILDVVKESIRVLTEQVEVSRNLLDQGLVARNDVLAAEVQLAQRKQERIAAENNVRLSRASLNRLMGLSVMAELDLHDVREADLWEGRLPALFQAAIQNRPDLSSLNHRIRAIQTGIRAAYAHLTPDIVAFGSYDARLDEPNPERDWFTAGIGVQIPFFQGGQTLVRVRRLRRELEQAVDRRNERADDVLFEVRQEFLNVEEAREQIPVARKNIQLADENLSVVRDQYNQGLVTHTDVLIEENRLTQARSSYFQALYGYHRSLAQLRHVVAGSLPGGSEEE